VAERRRADRSAAFLGWTAAFAIGAIGLAVAAAAVSASGAFEEPATTVPVGTNLPRPPVRPARPPSLAQKKPPDRGVVEAMREREPDATRENAGDAMREVAEQPEREPASDRTKRRARRARTMRSP
jgi:hypothetical protein